MSERVRIFTDTPEIVWVAVHRRTNVKALIVVLLVVGFVATC